MSLLTDLNPILPALLLGALLLGALLLDALLGEPRRWHPLVGFGRLAIALEQRANRGQDSIVSGALGVLVLVAPWVLLAFWLSCVLEGAALFALQVLGLWWALGWRSLGEHARAVAGPLAAGDLAASVKALSTLEGSAASAAQDWTRQANRRITLEAVLEDVRLSLTEPENE